MAVFIRLVKQRVSRLIDGELHKEHFMISQKFTEYIVIGLIWVLIHG